MFGTILSRSSYKVVEKEFAKLSISYVNQVGLIFVSKVAWVIAESNEVTKAVYFVIP
jgi:hypothetical protein